VGILGVSNPAPGVGKSILHQGNQIWAGWSGEVIVNNSTAEMFNFISPNVGLIATNFQYYVRHSSGSPATNEYVGWILTIDGIEIIANILKATSTQHFNDFDKNSFCLPGGAKVVVSSYTNTTANIPTFATFLLKEI